MFQVELRQLFEPRRATRTLFIEGQLPKLTRAVVEVQTVWRRRCDEVVTEQTGAWIGGFAGVNSCELAESVVLNGDVGPV